MFIETIALFSFFTHGKLQPTERKHYLDENELYGCLPKNRKNKYRDANA